jgi:hypothetical protein
MGKDCAMRRIGRWLALAACVVFVASCDEKLSEFAGPTPTLEPTFSSIQQDIFNSTDSAGRRACTACHTGAQPSAGLNLSDATSYASLVNVPSRNKPGAIRVVPGDPTNSYLIQKIEGAQGIVGERMPRTGGPYLTPNQITIIRRWIELGAPNN